MTSIAASPPWLLAYGGNDDGLQTGPLKEVQLEGRYSQKTKSSLISCFCSGAYGESILQMSSLLSTPHTKCII